MGENQHLDSWDKIIGKSLADLRSKFPKFSEKQIAEKINIPRATLNRLFNEPAKPRLDTLIKVIIASGNSEYLQSAIDTFDDDLGKSLRKIFQVSLTEKNKTMMDPELEDFLTNRELFVAYVLASLKNGIDKIHLVDALGGKGLEAMGRLIDKGLVEESDEKFHLKDKKTFVRSFQSVKDHLGTYASFYRVDHVGHERNYVHSLTEGLNKKGIKAIQDIHRRFHAELQECMRKDEFQGEIPVFSVAFCDSFTSLDTDKEVQ